MHKTQEHKKSIKMGKFIFCLCLSFAFVFFPSSVSHMITLINFLLFLIIYKFCNILYVCYKICGLLWTSFTSCHLCFCYVLLFFSIKSDGLGIICRYNSTSQNSKHQIQFFFSFLNIKSHDYNGNWILFNANKT